MAEHIFQLPVPEKAQKQTNFIILPRHASGITTAPAGTQTPEPILFTVPHTAAKTAFKDLELKPYYDPSSTDPIPTYDIVIQSALVSNSLYVTRPSDDEFASSIRESHRKNEVAYHVKAFRGSKEGYLFFLPDGIFFGFKKPLLFFEFAGIESISYTSVLQRTFNLNVAVPVGDGDGEQEFEFSMLDQADFAGIDEYVRRHGLNDKSMAAGRRARKVNVNGAAAQQKDGGAEAGAGVGGEAEGEEESELVKAQRELEDQDDEEEEDYDPGSEGISDGSGSGSDEEEEEYVDGGGDGGGDDDAEEDLVAEELGSEAEEVEVSDEEGSGGEL
jgi:hypothetical protein